jgi:UDP-glucose 4-epimerase
MRQIKNGEPLTIFGDGTQVREFTYIDDVTPYIARSYRREYRHGRTYNLGFGDKTNILGLAEAVSDASGEHQSIRWLPPRHEVHTSYPSTVLFRQEFSAKIKITLSSGLKAMWDWAKDAPVRRSKLPEIEVREGLYPYWEDV